MKQSTTPVPNRLLDLMRYLEGSELRQAMRAAHQLAHGATQEERAAAANDLDQIIATAARRATP
jgi:hypothetical protein